MMPFELPKELNEIIPKEKWDTWNRKQKEYIIQHQGASIGKVTIGEGTHSRHYSDKNWSTEESDDGYGNHCIICNFKYCFFARPRNWSMRSTSDVWNLMKCANFKCQNIFDSCS